MGTCDTAKILKCSSPFNACDEEDKVAIDLGAIDKHLNVAGIYRLSRLKLADTYTITYWTPQTNMSILYCNVPKKCWGYLISLTMVNMVNSSFFTFRTDVSAWDAHLGVIFLHLHLVAGTGFDTRAVIHHKVIYVKERPSLLVKDAS